MNKEQQERAEAKYSWQTVEENKHYVWHTEGDTKTMIAITDTSEKAHFLAFVANRYHVQEYAQPTPPPATGIEGEWWKQEPFVTTDKILGLLYKHYDSDDEGGWLPAENFHKTAELIYTQLFQPLQSALSAANERIAELEGKAGGSEAAQPCDHSDLKRWEDEDHAEVTQCQKCGETWRR